MKKILITLFLLLNLNIFSQSKLLSGSNKDLGIGLTVGGVAFTLAATLESSYQYGTYVKQPDNSEKYVIPSFWQQSPRNIMFIVGGTLTITGLFTMKQ